MNTTSDRWQDEMTDERISGRLERIADLKEALKHVRNIPEEMALLGDLTREITALRDFREARY